VLCYVDCDILCQGVIEWQAFVNTLTNFRITRKFEHPFALYPTVTLSRTELQYGDQFAESDLANGEITGSQPGATHPNYPLETQTCPIIPQHLLRLCYCQLSHRTLFAPSDRCLMYTKT
jgi:hypothetical protein